MKKYRIKLNNKVYEVEMEEVTGLTEESTYTITKSNSQVKSYNLEQSLSEVNVEAPMVGSILGISVKVGD